MMTTMRMIMPITMTMMTMITKITMMRSVAIAGDGDNANKCDTLNKSSAND